MILGSVDAYDFVLLLGCEVGYEMKERVFPLRINGVSVVLSGQNDFNVGLWVRVCLHDGDVVVETNWRIEDPTEGFSPVPQNFMGNILPDQCGLMGCESAGIKQDPGAHLYLVRGVLHLTVGMVLLSFSINSK
jgi:hypothetical protein